MDVQSALIGAGAAVGVIGCLLTGCSAIGVGRTTLVLARPETGSTPYPGTEFSQFIATPGRTELGLGGRPALLGWDALRASRYGAADRPIAEVDVHIRDLTTTPALDLFNVVTANPGDVAKVLSDKTLTPDQKTAILSSLQDAYRQLPESPSRLVLSRIDDKGRLVYNYYPTVSIDLTALLHSPEPSDRFDMIAVAIRLPADSKVRFINFSPKAADLIDFTLGSLKQTASATGSVNAGDTLQATTGSTLTPSPAQSSTRGSSGTATFGGSLSATASDEFTRDLKSSLEARSSGIFDNGRLFVVHLRANDQRRIAGTYAYEVMLEVPSTVQEYTPPAGATPTQIVLQSVPEATSATAAIRAVALVRHVRRFGETGVLKRVPEPTNDDVFQEAIVRDSSAVLWTFNNVPTASTVPLTNLKVFSNAEAASFSVFDTNGVLLKRGAGRASDLALPVRGKVRVVFDPLVEGAARLVPPKPVEVEVGPAAAVVGDYTLEPQPGAPKHGR